MKDLEGFNHWILMKLKTNVYDHDQKVLVLTDLMLIDRICSLIVSRRLGLVKVLNVFRCAVNGGGQHV